MAGKCQQNYLRATHPGNCGSTLATDRRATWSKLTVGRAMRPSFASTQETRRRMQAVRRRDTPKELQLRSLLHKSGLRYRVDCAPLPGLRRRADLVFPKVRIAVFVDGCFWHGCPEHATWPRAHSDWWREKLEANVRRDRDTDEKLLAAGWRVVRVWAHEDMRGAARRIRRIVMLLRRAANSRSRPK